MVAVCRPWMIGFTGSGRDSDSSARLCENLFSTRRYNANAIFGSALIHHEQSEAKPTERWVGGGGTAVTTRAAARVVG